MSRTRRIDGNAVTSHDIRITYEDEDQVQTAISRKLPLKTISKITLHKDGTVEDGIPYATSIRQGTRLCRTSTLSGDGASWS